MKIEKLTLSDTWRVGLTLNVITKITYIHSGEYEKLDAMNQRIAENLFDYLKNKLGENVTGNIVALLTPTLTYVDDDIISIEYDFTITSDRRILNHKRFCINMLYKQGILLLPRFLDKHRRIKSTSEFYLIRGADGELLCVPVIQSLQAGTVVSRRSEIDAYCDGRSQKVKIKVPHFLDGKKVRKK